EMKRNLARFNEMAKGVKFGKLSGAVVTYANTDPIVEKDACENLGLSAAPLSPQKLQRDRHAAYMSALALVATSIEKYATEIRGLQQTETREVEERVRKAQIDLSQMQEERIPIASENK